MCSRAIELFESDRSTVEQKRYLLDFVFQNMELNEKSLLLPLKQPFGAIQELVRNKDWCHISETFRNKHMTTIISIAKEVEMAKDFLEWGDWGSVSFAV